MKDTSDIPIHGHYMITQGGRLAMFTRCWNWNRGFKGDMAAQARNESQLLRSTPEAALDAAWARSQVTSPTSSAASGFELPTAAELQQWADKAIANNLYDKIMEALSQTHHYKDLNGNDVLNLIPKGLCLSEDQPGYLSCRHCLNKKSEPAVVFKQLPHGPKTPRSERQKTPSPPASQPLIQAAISPRSRTSHQFMCLRKPRPNHPPSLKRRDWRLPCVLMKYRSGCECYAACMY